MSEIASISVSHTPDRPVTVAARVSARRHARTRAARRNLATGTINLSVRRLNQDVRRTNPRRMEQPARLNYHFGHQ